MSNIGTLEETVLLLVMIHNGNAYGISIAEAYMEHTGKKISIPAIHTVLKRLEKKGFLKSEMSGATAERGGRRKRLFEITQGGYAVLQKVQESRSSLWSQVPKFNFK